MAFFKPGSYILYVTADAQVPSWPAVVVPDDWATPDIVRPHGYRTLVLLIKKLEYRWALPGEMQDFKFYGGDDEERQEADAIVLSALDNDPGLPHWKRLVTGDSDSSTSWSSHGLWPGSTPNSDYDSDPDLRQAIQNSLEECNQPETSSFPLSPSSTSPSKRKLGCRKPVSPKFEPDAHRRPRKNGRKLVSHPEQNYFDLTDDQSPTFPSTSKHLWQCGRFNDDDDEDNVASDESIVSAKEKRLSSLLLDTKRANLPLDAEIEDHSAFVEFLIGPNNSPFHVPKAEIDSRDYFTNPVLGANFLIKRGNSWSFERPCLREMSPESFKFVAQYLSTGEFGHRIIEDEEQRERAFFECAEAWEVADGLGMIDMLDYITQKMNLTMPWDLGEALAFGVVVYQTEGVPSDAHGHMKGALADFVAENYRGYLEHYPLAFSEHMIQAPEFLNDVHKRRVKKLDHHGEQFEQIDSAVRKDEEQGDEPED